MWRPWAVAKPLRRSGIFQSYRLDSGQGRGAPSKEPPSTKGQHQHQRQVDRSRSPDSGTQSCDLMPSVPQESQSSPGYRDSPEPCTSPDALSSGSMFSTTRWRSGGRALTSLTSRPLEKGTGPECICTIAPRPAALYSVGRCSGRHPTQPVLCRARMVNGEWLRHLASCQGRRARGTRVPVV